MRYLLVICSFLLIISPTVLAADKADEDIRATTATGDEVILHPNGYWEFKDTRKADIAKAKIAEYEQNSGCPRGSRPSFLGFGRCLAFDDPALKRGSLSGKGR